MKRTSLFVQTAWILGSCLTAVSSFTTPLPPIHQSRRPLTTSPPPMATRTRTIQSVAVNYNDDNAGGSVYSDLKVAIVGAGPSGLLLAHALLDRGLCNSLNVYEGRSRPEPNNNNNNNGGGAKTAPGRAYALGIGRRGRTAIQQATPSGKSLWEAIMAVGYASDRFQLKVGPLSLTLRDERDGMMDDYNEPSLLLYQSDLCMAMIDELEKKARKEENSRTRVSMKFETKVVDLDLLSKTLKTEDGTKDTFDVVIGADGVNSIVRQAMAETWPDFQANTQVLPGEYKVVRLEHKPPKLDPSTVTLMLPKSGGITAFFEPTVDNSACILFAGRNKTDPIFTSSNTTELAELIANRFPLLQGIEDEAAQQLILARQSTASTVQCNTFHCGGTAALLGDAAHATGGVSGQGVNSALQDSLALAQCLEAAVKQGSAKSRDDVLSTALLEYSKRQYPEGKAIYDLSFPPSPKSAWARIAQTGKNLADLVFKGRFGIGELPLQTKLTTSLEPFAEIRRKRHALYQQSFPEQAQFDMELEALHVKSLQVLEKVKTEV